MTVTQAADLYAPVAAGMAATERALRDLLSEEPESIQALVAQMSRYGGKRLRPALVHLTGGLVGEPEDDLPLIAAIVECLHVASLLHDDVLDGADTRRQVDTINALHGNEIPVLLGDLVYARAFSATLEFSTLHAARELAHASLSICRGEIEQSFFRFHSPDDEDRYYRIIRGKTAVLYGAACALGPLYSGGTRAQAEALRAFGMNLGLAFQIIDDCLDIIGDELVVGKSLGTDLETGKITLPILRLARRLDPVRRKRFEEILFAPIEGSRRDVLRAEFDLTEVLAECQAEANGHVNRCVEALQPFPDCPEKASLSALCSFVLGRRH